MQRVLITGMSGTGKSTLICALAERGYKAVDLDEDGWSELVESPGAPGLSSSEPERDCVWQEERVHGLLSTEDTDVLFVSGCAANQGKFYPRFDHIVLLSAPVSLMLARLASRTNNPYGKHPDEVAMVLHYTRTIQPLLRKSASLEIDTSAELEDVVTRVLQLVQP
jgi:dephospho-CoA kinase